MYINAVDVFHHWPGVERWNFQHFQSKESIKGIVNKIGTVITEHPLIVDKKVGHICPTARERANRQTDDETDGYSSRLLLFGTDAKECRIVDEGEYRSAADCKCFYSFLHLRHSKDVASCGSWHLQHFDCCCYCCFSSHTS